MSSTVSALSGKMVLSFITLGMTTVVIATNLFASTRFRLRRT